MDEARAWAAVWQRAAPLIDAERLERTRRTSLAGALVALEDAFEAALACHVASSTSGLVEQQRRFARLR
ncbi:MAG: hypothetical protein DCC68_18920 [Planctomycetota bacterium]|nr:MAG: hypothetical protein DCC68_18920 [Planctomycetota bacterium]